MKGVFWLIGAVAILRIALFAAVYATSPAHAFRPDSPSYITTAKALLYAGRFAKSAERPEQPELMRTPGYPLFLAGVFFLFGENYAAVIIIQSCLSLATIFLAALVAMKLWNSPRISLFAAALLSFDPPSIVLSQQVMTEALFTWVLMLAALVGLLALRPAASPALWGICAALLAAATYIRPISYYLIVPVGALALLAARAQAGWQWRRGARTLATLLIPYVALVGVWQVRNYAAAGTTAFSTISAFNLLFYRGADIVARRDGISFEQAREELGVADYVGRHPETRDWPEAQVAAKWEQDGIRLISRHPLLSFKSQLIGAAKMIFGPGEKLVADYWPFLPTWLLLAGASGYLLIVYAGLAAAMWAGWRAMRRKPSLPDIMPHLFLWTIILYFFAISAGPEAYSRFRIPVMPLLCVYAAYGFSTLFLRRARHQQRDALVNRAF